MMYTPDPYRKPNRVVKVYEKPFEDKAIITYVDYIDKKKRLIEGYVMFVKWRKNDYE